MEHITQLILGMARPVMRASLRSARLTCYTAESDVGITSATNPKMSDSILVVGDYPGKMTVRRSNWECEQACISLRLKNGCLSEEHEDDRHEKNRKLSHEMHCGH